MTGFERIRYLGGGYFGEVWLERDEALNRLCAAKYLKNGEDLGGRSIFAEAQAMALAEHPNVVQVYSADHVLDVPVIRMEFLPDGSIHDRYGKSALPVRDAVSAIEDACRGLEFLHNRNMLHRDIKPANLMLAPSGAIKVSDFGLACGKEQVSEAPIGYVTHLPPESVADPGYIDSVQGDVYAMGVTLHRLVNSDAVMDTEAWGDNLIDLIRLGRFPARDSYLPHVHDPLRKVIKKALHINAERRYKSPSELRHALEATRPVVSWQVLGEDTWDGTSADGQNSWRARVFPNKKGRSSFGLDRRRGDGKYRAIRGDSAVFDERSEAISHASIVLDRVARTGK
ncbi:serine/threonine-protein kinase [Kineosporia sp. NBRC 101731]|uniref:serine/threonine-protein kinase n=1 Tax=Kineosporia sp. NBRC 101731 TaxID=3032199 RepID=UPI00249FEF40|nr:serine/threonine-protein kinase [Kineosporia sp. NBRC 101731]GLY27423.1 hypothetical protein Kisp02_07880 [Kineosporia sp. NBRC 101731]